jgi:hypothetical protein
MNHVATMLGGVEVDLKTSEQTGAVYRVVPKARQQAALAFLSANVITTPAWLSPPGIAQRIGPSNVVSTRQAGVLTSLLTPARLGRLAESEKYDAANAYPLAEYMADLKRTVFSGNAPDAGRRQLQRVYVQRLESLVSPPTTPAGGPPGGGGGGGGAGARFTPFVTAPVLAQSDLPALARLQLREIQRDARTAAVASAGTTSRAHWSDIADRVTAILEPK